MRLDHALEALSDMLNEHQAAAQAARKEVKKRRTTKAREAATTRAALHEHRAQALQYAISCLSPMS